MEKFELIIEQAIKIYADSNGYIANVKPLNKADLLGILEMVYD